MLISIRFKKNSKDNISIELWLNECLIYFIRVTFGETKKPIK